MSADWLTIILAIVAVVVAWKVLKGIIKTVALVAILIVAAMVVFGGGF
ncbi:hypothetical protein [Erythrobacter sp. SD-21]|nr:hypothetical protein [Erythrobacter sp. SD-21]EDL50385.1 hypothetical protein ED21_27978 [Erythrobacter sp. SD-21]